MTALPPDPPDPSPAQPAGEGADGVTIGGDLAPALLRRIAVLHGFGMAMAGKPSTIIMTLRASDRELERALAAGARGYVEIESDLGLPVASLLRLAQPGQLHVSISTASCFSMSIAPILGALLNKQGLLPDDRRPDFELCLHEAVSNAVVHGNLGIRSGPGSDRDAFDRFHREIHSRMAVRDFARRRVSIDISDQVEGVLIAIGDEGAGYQPFSLEVAPDAKSGRGLRILRELADTVELTADGRRIAMLFKR